MIEFGIKLKEFGGYQDHLLLGSVDFSTNHDTSQLKELLNKSIKDYFTPTAEAGELSSIISKFKMTGKVEKVEISKLKDKNKMNWETFQIFKII